MSIQSTKLHVLYHPGTFGNCLKWMLDRFSPDSKLKGIMSPWDKDGRVHGFYGTWRTKDDEHEDSSYSGRFTNCHQEDVRLSRVSKDTPFVVINYDLTDQLFIERCGFYRDPGQENEHDRHKFLLANADKKFLTQSFGSGINDSKSVAKELYKIKWHDAENYKLFKEMLYYMQNDRHHQFPIDALFNKDLLIKELGKISEKFDLSLDIEEQVIDNVVNKTVTVYTVVTRHRAKQVLTAIEQQQNMDCEDLDIFEQAFIEAVLEKKHDSIIFPYGTSWFKNTDQINDFLNTYPAYLKHMNPRLPWYNNIKNPFYLTGRIDKSK